MGSERKRLEFGMEAWRGRIEHEEDGGITNGYGDDECSDAMVYIDDCMN